MRPVEEIMAAMGRNATTRQKIERLQSEIPEDASGVPLGKVLEEYVASVADFLANIVLDLAQDIGAIPSRKKAERELREALELIRVVAVYKTLQLQEAADETE